jgi:tetratricopeptide (TPR) repeat protein
VLGGGPADTSHVVVVIRFAPGGVSIIEDTQTETAPPDALVARIEELKRDPSDRELFVQVRDELRREGRGDLLAEILELRARHPNTPQVEVVEAWSEVGEVRLAMNQPDGGRSALDRALALDPTSTRAVDLLVEHHLAHGRAAAAADVLETELAERERKIAGTPAADPSRRPRRDSKAPDDAVLRRAELHRRAAELWGERLGRVDRALAHWQQAWRLEPTRTDALDAARKIYRSLGDDEMVARLYQSELEVIGERGPAPARAGILVELGRLAKRTGDTAKAIGHLERAAELDPENSAAREVLAELYASPSYRVEGGAARAGALFADLGRRMATRDDGTAITYLRRALGVDPHSKQGFDALDQALASSGKWDELDRLLKHRGQIVEDPDDRAALIRRRIELYEDPLPDRDALIEALEELAVLEPSRGPASMRLRELLREDQRWPELAARIEMELDAGIDDPSAITEDERAGLVREILDLATIVREHIGDRDHAAELLHRALSVDPIHEEALARYSEHFRERRDWRGLTDLLEFALDNAREAGADGDEQVRRLEEIAQLAELRLGDLPRAIESWRRIQELEPASTKASEALRRLLARAKMWEQLVAQLEHEAQQAQGPMERAEALRRMAQTYRERQIEPRRAIALYEEILTMFPDDDAALKAAGEMYERDGDDAGLATTLRRQLELEVRRLDATSPEAKRGAAREWPVGKRVERLTMLRRLAQLAETRLADVDGVVYACSGVLELLPGDRDALERMERVLEKAGDPRLEQTLEYHATSAGSPAERAKVLRKLARMASATNDDARALERWEQTLRAVPTDAEALQALAGLYERTERWPELAAALERLDAGKIPTPQGTPVTPERLADLERYATVVDKHLGDPLRAIKAWQRLLELSPKHRGAVAALVRLYRNAGKWRELAEALDLQIAISTADDPAAAATAALERAALLEERLGAPADAIRQLERLIMELDPTHLDAHTALRRLHETRGDFESAVRVAEREMYLAPDNLRKVARGLEIGMLCRDRLGDPVRALQAFTRVLALETDHDEALIAAGELHARLGQWKEHARLLERQLGTAGDRWARRELFARLAEVTSQHLDDPTGGFRWWKKAHDEGPGDDTLDELRRTAEAYGLWRELADVLLEERKRLLAPGIPAADTFVALSRELAGVMERRLNDRPKALVVLAEAVAVSPRDGGLLSEMERIAADADHKLQWRQVLDAHDLALAAATPAERVDLHARRAKILEDKLGDARAAAAEILAAFSWAPDREDTRTALYRIAEKTRLWNDVVGVEAALVDRATSDALRLAALRRKAQVIEDQLKDAPRAFRTHLVGFLIAPDDSETTAHLWRLARVIGKYKEADKTPKGEPASAMVQGEQAIAEAVASANRVAPGRPRPQRPSTDDLDVSAAVLAVGDSTQPIDIGDALVGRLETAPVVDPPAPVAGVGKEQEFDNRTVQLTQLDLQVVAPGRPVGAAGGGPPPPPPRRSGSATKPPPFIPPASPNAKPTVAGFAAGPAAGDNRTIELSQLDLAQQPAPPAVPPRRGPPPPPPRPPQISASGRPPPPPAPVPRKTQATVRRAPLPSLPVRAFESPWEEFAVAHEILPALESSDRIRWLFRASEVWETGAHDLPRAFDTLARAFGLARQTPAGDGEVRDRLHRLATDHKAWDRLADLYEGLAEDAESAVAAADLLMEVARIRISQGKPADAEAHYRRVLGMRPEDEVARARLEELYRSANRWVELAASLEERTDPRLGTAAPEAERPQLLRELAGIYTTNLHRPHDAIEALERLRQLAPQDTDVMVQVSTLYGSVGRWSKAIEVLQKIGEVAEGQGEHRDALRRIAAIYENELELPERATETYAQLVAIAPDDSAAWEALDRQYQAHARWTELAEVLRRRAALAPEPRERADLLARRAKILLEWLDGAEEAVAALRHARTIAPDDPALADQLVIALGKSARDREAAAVLEGRIEALRETETPVSRGELAALHIRLAQIRIEKLRDPTGARAALDEAFRLVPDHPTALSVQAMLVAPDEDPRAFADAKLKEAERAPDDDARIAALMAAGDVLREKVGDADEARTVFEKVLALRPYHADATWALAGLVEKSGDPEAAAKLLERRLDHEQLPPAEKARVMTQLAALGRSAGVEPIAERRLLEALGADATHLPAVIALCDLYADRERWEELEGFLRDTLRDDSPTLIGAPGALVADLNRRFALAQEKLGRDEDAYQTLVTADRTHRGHLLIKLALGENRYKARRWREAAIHLSALATHDEAMKYPAEVAQGLYHAALAEIRSLRPEKAPALYARALELKPNYGPALQAMAELAMEGGDTQRAAELLTRQATATDDPAERLRLFEALGDMAVMMLGDEERARVCYEAAVGAADVLEARHLPLLEKLLVRQDLAGDSAGAARTSELMAAFDATPQDRAARYVRAARDYVAAGDKTRARAAADHALEADAYDLDAMDLASELALDAGDPEACASLLGRGLSAKGPPPPPGAKESPDGDRRAILWHRLGVARNQRGDAKQATQAFERAVAAAPRSEGAVLARRNLVTALRALGLDDTGRREQVLEHLRAIVESSAERHDVVVWADELRRAGKNDAACLALELAKGLGHTLDVHQTATLTVNRPATLRPDAVYRGAIDAEDHAGPLADPDEAGLLPVMQVIAEAANLLWSDTADVLSRGGLGGAKRVPATLHSPAVAMFPRLISAVGGGATMLYMRDDAGAPDVQVACAATPIVILGPRLLADPPPPDAELRFLIGRAAELARPERMVAVGLPKGEAARVIAAVARLFGPPPLREAADRLIEDQDVQRARDDVVKSALPLKLRSRLEQVLSTMSPDDLDLARYTAACERIADRVGLALCGDASVTFSRVIARGAGPSHLVRAAAHPGWMALRHKLGIGVRAGTQS